MIACSAAALLTVGSVGGIVGLVVAAYSAANKELERTERRRDWDRRYGGSRR